MPTWVTPVVGCFSAGSGLCIQPVGGCGYPHGGFWWSAAVFQLAVFTPFGGFSLFGALV